MLLELPSRPLSQKPTARLVDLGGTPVVGATIVLTGRFRERTCTAVTNSQGRATCDFGRYMDYEAVFAGDAFHDAASARTWTTRR